MDIGAAYADRYVVAIFGKSNCGSGPIVVTIGGISANVIGNSAGGDNSDSPDFDINTPTSDSVLFAGEQARLDTGTCAWTGATKSSDLTDDFASFSAAHEVLCT